CIATVLLIRWRGHASALWAIAGCSVTPSGCFESFRSATGGGWSFAGPSGRGGRKRKKLIKISGPRWGPHRILPRVSDYCRFLVERSGAFVVDKRELFPWQGNSEGWS